MITEITTGTFVAVYVADFVVFLTYAIFLYWMNSTGRSNGWTPVTVGIGVFLVLTITLPLHHNDPVYDFAFTFMGFVVGGIPITIGSWLHYSNTRKQKEEKEQAASNNTINKMLMEEDLEILAQMIAERSNG